MRISLFLILTLLSQSAFSFQGNYGNAPMEMNSNSPYGSSSYQTSTQTAYSSQQQYDPQAGSYFSDNVFENCPYRESSRSVAELQANLSSFLQARSQASGKGCTPIQDDYIDTILSRYGVTPTQQTQGQYDYQPGGGDFQYDQYSGSDIPCRNYKETLEGKFSVAMTYASNDLSIPRDNPFYEVCEASPQASMDPNFDKSVCVENNIGKLMAVRKKECQSQAELQQSENDAENLIKLTSLLSEVATGKCQDEGGVLKESLFNVVSSHFALSPSAFPGLGVASFAAVIQTMFEEDNGALNKLLQKKEVTDLKCIYLGVEKEKCKSDALLNIKGPQATSGCYQENKLGLDTEVLQLADQGIEMVLGSQSPSEIINILDDISKNNFLREFKKVRNYVQNNKTQNPELVDRIGRTFEKDEKVNQVFNGLMQLMDSYDQLKSNGESPAKIGHLLKKDIRQKFPTDTKVNLVDFFYLYRDLKLNEMDNKDKGLITSLKSYESEGLAFEVMEQLRGSANKADNDRANLNLMLAAITEQTKDSFSNDFEESIEDLKAHVDSLDGDSKGSNIENQDTMRLARSVVQNCKLLSGIYYYDDGKNRHSSQIAKGDFDKQYKNVCQSFFKKCMKGDAGERPHELRKYVCQNIATYDYEALAAEGKRYSSVCGRSHEDIFEEFKKSGFF